MVITLAVLIIVIVILAFGFMSIFVELNNKMERLIDAVENLEYINEDPDDDGGEPVEILESVDAELIATTTIKPKVASVFKMEDFKKRL